MDCIVCGSNLFALQMKCSKCGAEAIISTGNFIFKFDSEDEKVIKNYYETFKQQTETASTEKAKSLVKSTNTSSQKSKQKPSENINPKEEYNLGMNHYLHKEYSEAAKCFRKAAEAGDSKARYQLGYCYEHGLGVKCSKLEAEKWYKKSAKQGCALAKTALEQIEEAKNTLPDEQYYLAYTYYQKKDYNKAFQWFLKSAEQGYSLAQYGLGCCYYNGEGVTQSDYKALEWFRRSAEQGEKKAQYMLGVCYENGLGTTNNVYEAKKWYTKASNQGYQIASDALQNLQNSSYNYANRRTYNDNSYGNTYTDSPSTNTRDNTRRSLRTGGIQRISGIGDVLRIIWAIVLSVILGVGYSLIVLPLINDIVNGDILDAIVRAIAVIIATVLILIFYPLEFSKLRDDDILFGWLTFEMIAVPILLITIFVGGRIGIIYVPAMKYEAAEFYLAHGEYSQAKEYFSELGEYNDSAERANLILAQYPTTAKKGDTILFGSYEQDNNYENGKEDIEWQVVYGSSYVGYASYVTLISKNALEYKYFDTNYWENSSLRYWLNNDFLNEAFTPEQQAVLDVTGGYNTDKVDVFAIGYKPNFPAEILHTTPTEYARSKGTEDLRWCFRWTNKNSSFETNTIQVSYVDGSGTISDDVPDGYFYIRPVVRLKIYAYENQLAYGDNYYTELYNSDLSGLLKTYTGTYVAGQGITCMDFTITSCDKYGNIDADIFFYAHESNPNVPSGRYKVKGCITGVNKDDGSMSIDIVGDKWISRPNDYEMLELSIKVDSHFSSITGGYQFDLKAVE